MPDCLCTNVKISRKIIPPGGQAQLHVEFDIGGRWGRQRATTRIISNDPDQPVVAVALKGIAKTTLPIFPKEINLGRIVDKKKVIFRKIQIRDPGTGDLEVKKVETSSDAIQAEIIQKEKGADAEIHLLINPERFKGKFEGYITIHTNDRKTPRVKIPLRGEIVGPIQILPERLFFGFIRRGKVFSQSVMLKSREKGNWRITKVETSSQEISIKVIPIIVGQQYKVNVDLLVDKSNSESIVRERIKIHTTHPECPLIEVPVYAIVER